MQTRLACYRCSTVNRRAGRWQCGELESSVPVQVMRMGGDMRIRTGRQRAATACQGFGQCLGPVAQRTGLAAAQCRCLTPLPGAGATAAQLGRIQTQSIGGTAVENLNMVPVTLTQPGLYLLEAHSPRFATHLAAALAARDSSPFSAVEPRASLVQVTNLNVDVRLSGPG